MRNYLLGGKLRRTQLLEASPRRLPAVCETMEPRRLLAHHLITFDDVPAGTVVTGQFPGVSFSSPGDANVVVRKADVGTSGGSEPNEIGGDVHLTDALQLDFDQP